MKSDNIKISIWTAIISVAILTSAIYISSTPETIKNGSLLRLTLRSEPPTLDWSLATDGVSFEVITNIMEGLTEYDENLRPRPAIAERWEVSEDGKRYTFFLRSDVKWTDGKTVTAGDFVYSWRRLLAPETGAEYAYFLYDIVNAHRYNSGAIKDPYLVGVRAKSDFVLEVDLEKPIVYFPSITTFMVTFPQRQDIIERHGYRWTEPENIVTNGPFKLS
ncbi:MAG: ABC transporter substrate-binding protein, partial [Nitrospirota bacterium]